MSHVKSKDGTAIAYTRGGDGPAVVLVGGGLDDGSENATLIPALADSFARVNWVRCAVSAPLASGQSPAESLSGSANAR